MKILNKSHNHDHFWIENGIIHETYLTIRGPRFREIAEVDYPDIEFLSDSDI